MPRFDAGYVPKTAMTIFAHPDDAEFSCGGTLAAWSRAGCEVTMVLCTNGNAGTHDVSFTRESLAATREAEQRAANEVMGVARLVLLDHHDCELQPTMELRRSLVQAIREHKPEVVICGDADAWFYEYSYINHPDHRAAAQAAIEAVFPCAEMELLWPELGPVHKVHAVYIAGQREANVFVDITDTMDDKVAALRCHVSQMGDWDPGDMVRAWASGDAKRVRKADKAARKAAKKAAKKAGGQDGAPPATDPAAEPRKPRYVEGYRVMVLKQDDVSY